MKLPNDLLQLEVTNQSCLASLSIWLTEIGNTALQISLFAWNCRQYRTKSLSRHRHHLHCVSKTSNLYNLL